MVVVDIVVLLTIVEKLRRDLRNLSWWDKLPKGTELLISIFSQFPQNSGCYVFNSFFSSVWYYINFWCGHFHCHQILALHCFQFSNFLWEFDFELENFSFGWLEASDSTSPLITKSKLHCCWCLLACVNWSLLVSWCLLACVNWCLLGDRSQTAAYRDTHITAWG